MIARRPSAVTALTLLLAALLLTPHAAAQPAADQPSVVWEQPARGIPAPPPVTASSYVLMDVDTGQILAEREADEPRPVASTVKVLTVLTALPHVDLDDLVTVGEEVQVGGAGVGLDPGDTWTVEDLLEAIVARSGNDAARALAVHVGGTVEQFVEMMQSTADDLGLDTAVILDPSGLDDTNLLSARDLATITREAMADDTFRQIAVRPSVALPSLGTVETRNLLLETYAGATGVKTGYTDLAGWCLVGSAERDGRELLAVVLDARTDDDRFGGAATLLDFGFEQHVLVPVPQEVRLRRSATWIPHEVPVDHVWVPADGRQESPGRITVQVPERATASMTMTAVWEDISVATIRTAPSIPADVRSELDNARQELGARWADAMYRAMRVAHERHAWPAGA